MKKLAIPAVIVLAALVAGTALADAPPGAGAGKAPLYNSVDYTCDV